MTHTFAVEQPRAPQPARPQPFRGRAPWIIGLLAVTAVLVALSSIVFGAANVSPAEAFGVVMHRLTGAPVHDRIVDAIIWQNRVPRVLTGLGVGAILGVAGVIFQAIVRNPLAEPYVLGISSGASLGAATAIVLLGASAFGVAGLALLGAGLATAAVLAIGQTKAATPLHLILAGLAVGFLCHACTNLLIFASKTPETAQSVVFWTLGSLTRADWPQVLLLLVTAAVMTLALVWAAPIVDALASGDSTCLAVGISPSAARLALVFPVSAAVGLAVAHTGGIGFVGLVIPHLLRPLVGYAHRALIVATALASSIFLMLADIFARTAWAPAEIPIGVMTGLIGAPILLLMLTRGIGQQRGGLV